MHARASEPRDTPRVLFDFTAPPRPTNPYTSLLLEAVAPYVTAVPFSWRDGLLRKYSLLHVNWPEKFVRSPSRVKTLVKYVLTVLLLCRLTLTRTPVVRTVHNLNPHEAGLPIERPILRWLDRLVLIRIYLNESPHNDYSAGAVILHGAYPPSTVKPTTSTANRSPAVSTFGLLRPFKGLEQLVEAVAELDDVTLRIAGMADHPAYARELRELTADRREMQFIDRFLDDDELDQLMFSSDLVVFPYRYMYNSGATLLALSRNRHVLVPESASTLTLQAEVGTEWVSLFRQPLTPAHIEAALQSARSAQPKSRQPDFSRRQWPQLGALHGELYRAVIAVARAERDRPRARGEIRRRLGQSSAFRNHSAHNASSPTRPK